MSTQKYNLWKDLGQGLCLSLGGLVLMIALLVLLPYWLLRELKNEMKR